MKKEKAVKETPKKIPSQECMVVEPKQEISVYQQQQASVENMIMQAIKEGTPVETFERVLAMRKELKAEYAKVKLA
jgi:tRNA1(Val) A37 N6-methylase TrmN6